MAGRNYEVLRTAKSALDEGLINDADYDKIKTSFLRAQQIKAGLDAGFIKEEEYANVKRSFLESLSLSAHSSAAGAAVGALPCAQGALDIANSASAGLDFRCLRGRNRAGRRDTRAHNPVHCSWPLANASKPLPLTLAARLRSDLQRQRRVNAASAGSCKRVGAVRASSAAGAAAQQSAAAW